jgi:gliding motility-associated-like protein
VRFALIFTAFVLIPLVSEAQLTAPGVNAVRYTSYPSAPGQRDPVFIFCNQSGIQKGVLKADSPGGTAPYNFSWYKWDDATKSFSIFIRADILVNSSSLVNLEEGGYKVTISDGGGYTANMVAWIFIDRPVSVAKLQNFTCDYVALSGKAAIDTFYYKDPANGLPVKLKNGVTFLWTSSPASAIPFSNIEINPVTYSPPLEDVTYKLQVADSFLCNSESSFPYTSIHVKADFTADPVKGEAPLDVSFTDKSIRGTKMYTWEFGEKNPDGLKKPDLIIKKDSLWVLASPVLHRYYIPGEYSVKLTIESDQGCIDSMRFDKIVVDLSELHIPNVFTPDGDGINDFFVVESKSLRSLYVEIFSRSGLMVHSFTGEREILKDYKGWDGNVNKSSIHASPGVYFYIIRAVGWDEKVYNSKEYRGFFYLYR